MPGLKAEAASTAGSTKALVWMPRHVDDVCLAEASSRFPLETGGTFMGWWADTGTIVITAVIGPGPDARHGSHYFEPDQAWQLDQIARHYECSGCRETYLGDWHSHPDAKTGSLSWVDRRVLRRIITTSRARAPNPLMMVLYGAPDRWQSTLWTAGLERRSLWWSTVSLREAEPRLY